MIIKTRIWKINVWGCRCCYVREWTAAVVAVHSTGRHRWRIRNPAAWCIGTTTGSCRTGSDSAPPFTEASQQMAVCWGCQRQAGTSPSRTALESHVVTPWLDNRVVLLASNFVGKGQINDVRRWSKAQKQFITVKRSEVVKLYNGSMGGVDKMYFLIQLYRIFIRSRKWTLRVIFHYVSVAVNNSWLEYQRDAVSRQVLRKKRFDLFRWTFETAEALCKAGMCVWLNRNGVAHRRVNNVQQRNRNWTCVQLLMSSMMLSATGLFLTMYSSARENSYHVSS